MDSKPLDQCLSVLDQSRSLLRQIEKTDDLRVHLDVEVEPVDADEVFEADRLSQYLAWVSVLEELNDGLEAGFQSDKDVLLVVPMYKNCLRVTDTLRHSKCKKLYAYASNLFAFWHVKVLDKLTLDFETLLTNSFNWPQCVLNDEAGSVVDHRSIDRFQRFVKILHDIGDPPKFGWTEGTEVTPKTGPLDLLVKPLKRRFKFHFYGTKKTNNPDKPEWFFNQILTWVRRSKTFFKSYMDPELEESIQAHRNLTGKLFKILLDKLKHDLQEIPFDDLRLSHLVDELLVFAKEVERMGYGAKAFKENHPVTVLSEKSILSRWIILERKFAFEKIDGILLDDNAWNPSLSNPRVSKGTENFLTLIQSMTSRFQLVNDVDLRLQFLDLECELIEDLRMRFVHVLRQSAPLQSNNFCLILSSSQHIIQILETWADIPLFLQLHYEKFHTLDTSSGLFTSTIEGFQFMVNEMTTTLADSIYYEVKSASRPYRKDCKWFAYQEASQSASPESLAIFQILASHLEYVNERLAPDLVGRVTEAVAGRMKELFVIDLILENKLNPEGAQQIANDVRKGLIPLCKRYMPKGDTKVFQYFGEVCTVLCMAKPKAVLCMEALENCRDAKEQAEIMEDIGISHCQKDLVIAVLKQRTDLVC